MITWLDAKNGNVSLAEIVHINNYLDFIADTKYFANLDANDKAKKQNKIGRRR